MRNSSKSGVIGATLIGVGCGLTAMGLALVIPACSAWSLGFIEQALRKGREGAGNAAEFFGEIAGKTHQHFNQATKTAKATTSKAAGVVENAARRVRQYTS